VEDDTNILWLPPDYRETCLVGTEVLLLDIYLEEFYSFALKKKEQSLSYKIKK
jgi:hypothetical protein